MTRNPVSFPLKAMAVIFAVALTIVAVPAIMAIATDFIPISDKHNPDHTPILNPEAKARVENIFTNVWNAGPPTDPDTRCVAMKLGETAFRWIAFGIRRVFHRLAFRVGISVGGTSTAGKIPMRTKAVRR